MTEKLDTTKPYGEIYGKVDSLPKAKYTQGYKIFDAQGRLIRDDTPKEHVAEVEDEVPEVEEEYTPPTPTADVAPVPKPVAPKIPTVPRAKK